MRLAAKVFWSLGAAVAYTYAGYPAILALLGRRRPEPPAPEPERLPSVTLIIAAYNEEQVILEKLGNAIGLDYPRDLLEIIVAADGSSDRTAALVRDHAPPGVRLLHRPQRRGKVPAINRAAAAASGEILVFSDANNSYAPDAIRELVRPFADPSVGGVIGAKHVVRGEDDLGDGEGLYWRYESFIQRMETRLGSCTAAVGEIMAVRRTAFEPAPEGIICEDFYQVMRLLRRGHRVVYQPSARSIERVSATPGDEMKRRTNIIAGRFQAMSMARQLLPVNSPRLVWQVLSHKFMRPLVPIAMIGMALSNLVLAVGGSRRWLAMLVAQAAFYLTAWLGTRTALPGPGGRIATLAAFLVRSNVAALMGLRRFALNRDGMHLWERVQRGSWTDAQPTGEADLNSSISRPLTTSKS